MLCLRQTPYHTRLGFEMIRVEGAEALYYVGYADVVFNRVSPAIDKILIATYHYC